MKKFPALANPFPDVGYHGPDYFCDREHETREIKNALKQGRNVTLIARRRLGKTSLLHHLQHELSNARPAWKVIYIDLNQTSSLSGLYKELATALYAQRKKSAAWNLPDVKLLSRLRMTVSVDENLMPNISFDLKEGSTEPALRDLLEWIGEEKNCLVIFDEFQQLLTYPEKNVEGWLRGEVQKLGKVRFIFSGSDQHILTEMFANAARPFYRSSQNIPLGFIDPAVYKAFIQSKFAGAKRSINTEALDYIHSITEGETLAVQRLCNFIFAGGYSPITIPVVQQCLQSVIQSSQADFVRVRALLKPASVMFAVLRAVARVGPVQKLNSKEFVRISGVLNTSSILKAANALLGYSLISKRVGQGGDFAYEVDDALFKLWLNSLS